MSESQKDARIAVLNEQVRELKAELDGLKQKLAAVQQHYEKRPDFRSYLPDGRRDWYEIGVQCRTWFDELEKLLGKEGDKKS